MASFTNVDLSVSEGLLLFRACGIPIASVKITPDEYEKYRDLHGKLVNARIKKDKAGDYRVAILYEHPGFMS